MVKIEQGEIWWTDLGEPTGSEPGYRRPVVIVQSNALNRSRISTAICVVLTSNMAWANAPGNVILPKNSTGLAKDSVANVSQIVTLDRENLIERSGKLSPLYLEIILQGIDIVLHV